MDVTLEQLCNAIECWNYMYGQKKGQFGASVHDILEGSALFAKPDTKWVNITSGPLAGSRYTKIQHGLVIQEPKPSNNMSLMQESAAKLVGIKV